MSQLGDQPGQTGFYGRQSWDLYCLPGMRQGLPEWMFLVRRAVRVCQDGAIKRRLGLFNSKVALFGYVAASATVVPVALSTCNANCLTCFGCASGLLVLTPVIMGTPLLRKVPLLGRMVSRLANWRVNLRRNRRCGHEVKHV